MHGVAAALSAAPHAYPSHLSWKIYQTPGDEVYYPDPSVEIPPVKPGSPTVFNPAVTSYPLHLAPMNRGSEAISYLQAIVDAWDELEQGTLDAMVFMHAHWWSHHTHLMHD